MFIASVGIRTDLSAPVSNKRDTWLVSPSLGIMILAEMYGWPVASPNLPRSMSQRINVFRFRSMKRTIVSERGMPCLSSDSIRESNSSSAALTSPEYTPTHFCSYLSASCLSFDNNKEDAVKADNWVTISCGDAPSHSGIALIFLAVLLCQLSARSRAK